MGDTKVSLKLLIDTKAKRVLFAEAGKDFVDFLFHLLSLPLSTVVKLLTPVGNVGSLANLSKSIQALTSDYFQHNVTEQTVLQHVVLTSVEPPPLFLLDDASISQNNNKLYRCLSESRSYPNCRSYVARHSGTRCPNCSSVMSTLVTCVEPKSLPEATSSRNSCKCSVGGYVKGGATTYMVMDNLEVKPMSTISSIRLLANFNVKDVSALVDRHVVVGIDEGIAILKAAMDTQAVLTAVFKQAIETESKSWIREKKQQQNALPKHVTPVFRSFDLVKKADEIDRLCRPIMSRPRPGQH